jgi:hypothetical protein
MFQGSFTTSKASLLNKSILWKVVTILMTGLLLLSALVQWNDPDPFRWIVCYSVTAIITLCSLIRPLPPSIPLIWGLLVLLSSLFVGIDFLMSEEQFEWDSFWNVMAMKNEAVELGRELGGLLLVTGWMSVLTWKMKKV